MKKIYYLALLLFSMFSFSQVGGTRVGIGTTTPDRSAQLEVSSTTKGFLPPRMTYAQRNAIPSPAPGLQVWCTDCGTALGTPDPLTRPGASFGQMHVFNGVDWINLMGEYQNFVVPTPPLIPVASLVTDIITLDKEVVEVSFDIPVSDGGVQIYQYAVTATQVGTNITHTEVGSYSPIFFNNLTIGTEYTFTVVAINGVGSSDPSVVSNAVIPKRKPDAPTNLVLTYGDEQVSVAFTAPVNLPPTNGGATITGYGYKVLCYLASDNSFVSETAGSSSPIDVTGLTNGTAYTFKVVAINIVGPSLPSAPSDETPKRIPDAPSSLVLTYGDEQVEVAFTEPSNLIPSNGGSEITGYKVLCYLASDTSVIFSETAGSSSPILVTGLTNGTNYTFTVVATNIVGNSVPSSPSDEIPKRVPDAPTNVDPTFGNVEVSVAFTAPDSVPTNGGSTITGYTVLCYLASDTSVVFSETPGTSSPIIVTGLTNGTAYTFRVFATNEVGSSDNSDFSEFEIPMTVPDAPTNVIATYGDTEVSVAFTAPDNTPPANGGSTITGYRVICYLEDGTTYVTDNSDSTSPIVVGGLTNGTTYIFTVVAINEVGDSLESADSNSEIPKRVPDAPTNLVLTYGDEQVSVAFTAPDDSAPTNGGSTITGYKVLYHLASDTSNPPVLIEFPGANSPILVTGLTNGDAYIFTVVAINEVGDSSPSSPSNETPKRAPDAPTNVIPTSGNSEISVAFTAPENSAPTNGGSTITGYTVLCYLASDNSVIFSTTLSTGSPTLVEGLTNGTDYTFTVIATNEVGDSPASAPSNPVAPKTVPDAPSIRNVVPGNTTASVEFISPLNEPPTNGGSTITGYTVRVYQTGQEFSGTDSPIEVTGLTNGDEYTFTVVAINEVGPSLPSVISDSTTPRTVPNVPADIVATYGNAQATIDFIAPFDNGGSQITSYTVTSYPSGATATITGTSTSIIFTGLTNGTEYTFTVVANNAAGSSNASNVSNAVTPKTVPGAPRTPTATLSTLDNSIVNVTFTAPLSDGGSEIGDYTVITTPSSQAVGVNTGLSIEVTGLTPGVSYTFKVVANNEVGSSVPSISSNAVTPRVAPNAPTNVVAVVGNSQATVSFTRPTSTGGSSITSYTVTADPSGLTQTITGVSSPIIFTGLTNGTAYTFTVVANNAAGPSVPSAPSNSVTPRTVPGAPLNVSAVKGDSQATVTFSLPSTDGGNAITSYTVTSNPGGLVETVDDAGTPAIVTGLTNGTPYTFTVVATNEAGNSVPSDPTSPITPYTVPDAPTTLLASYNNNQGVTSVVFETPDNGGNAIDDYVVTSFPGNIVRVVTTSPAEFNDLTFGTAYVFTAVARNMAGSSETSAPSNSVTPLTNPNPPVVIGVVNGIRQGTISFSPPTFNGGSQITSYSILSDNSIVASGISSPLTVTNVGGSPLIGGQQYVFSIIATNGVGNSIPAEQLVLVTPRDTPIISTTAITNISATAATSGGEVTNERGADVTSRGVCWSTSSNPTILNAKTINSGTTGSFVSSITGLTENTVYHVRAYATNSAGTGYGENVMFTAVAPPGAPTSVTAVAGVGQATVSFNDSFGVNITGYTVTSTPGNFTNSGIGSPITVSGLAAGTAYTFTVVATNAAGNSNASLPSAQVMTATVPSPIVITSVTRGGGRAFVYYTPPVSNGGSAITLYTVNTGSITNTALSPSNYIEVVGLDNQTEYSFSMFATNSVGNSASSNDFVLPAATVPGTPTSVSAVEGNGQATVSFTAPASNGGMDINNYTVTSDPATAPVTGSSPLTFGGLTNGTAYTFTVVANNGVGSSPASPPSTPVTPYTVPSTPSAPNAVAGNGQATVYFSAPTSNGGSEIISYTATANPGNLTSTPSLSEILTIQGLTNGTDYTFTVVATNAAGNSSASAPSNSVTPSATTVPLAPVISFVNKTTAITGLITLTTNNSSNGGSPITSYSIETFPPSSATLVINPGGNTLTINSLVPNIYYAARISATNAVGISSWSQEFQINDGF